MVPQVRRSTWKPQVLALEAPGMGHGMTIQPAARKHVLLHESTAHDCLHSHKAAIWDMKITDGQDWISHFQQFSMLWHSCGGSGGRELLFQAGPSNRWPLGLLNCPEDVLHKLSLCHPTQQSINTWFQQSSRNLGHVHPFSKAMLDYRRVSSTECKVGHTPILAACLYMILSQILLDTDGLRIIIMMVLPRGQVEGHDRF